MPRARRTLLQSFGQRVRSLRLESGLSQEQLGFDAGLHPTYISGIERGLRNVGLRNIVGIAMALGVDPGELVEGLRADRLR